ASAAILFCIACGDDGPSTPTLLTEAGVDAGVGDASALSSPSSDAPSTASRSETESNVSQPDASTHTSTVDSAETPSNITDDAGTNSSTGADSAPPKPLYCGDYVRVDSDDRGQIPPYVRNRDEAALESREWECVLGDAPEVEKDAGASTATVDAPDYLPELGCLADFNRLASHTAAGPSVKVLIDRWAPKAPEDDYPVYFINSQRYGLHYDFASAPKHLNVGPQGQLPAVGTLQDFNATEYTSPSRRFLLGALSYYGDSDTWVYELAPNDAASAELILTAWDLVEKHAWVGLQMKLHTTSDAIASEAKLLPEDVEAIPTSELINQTYQP